MKRILIIGPPGSGKSTLGRKLKDRLHLPLTYLDCIWHQADGSHISGEEFERQIRILTEPDAWILDGSYRRTLPLRLARADTVIWLDYPMDVCLKAIQDRMGKPREDLPWQETGLDPEFLQHVLSYPKRVSEIEQILQSAPHIHLIRLFSREQTQVWLESLPAE